jgi:1,4-alpha-glucan branching enzyme
MNQKTKPTKTAAQESRPVPIRFEFTHPAAASVCLAGSFNEWQPSAASLRSVGDGRWEAKLELAPGIYEYCFVVDGRWTADPLADRHVSNPFGGYNSLLRVGCSLEADHLTEAETRPMHSADTRG